MQPGISLEIADFGYSKEKQALHCDIIITDGQGLEFKAISTCKRIVPFKYEMESYKVEFKDMNDNPIHVPYYPRLFGEIYEETWHMLVYYIKNTGRIKK